MIHPTIGHITAKIQLVSSSSNDDHMIEQTGLKLYEVIIHSLSWNRNMT
jgi:hypothetical protein